MDLSFPHPVPAAGGTLSSADLAQLIAVLGDRQAASATARVQSHASPPSIPAEDMLLAPAAGAFNAAMAARLRGWRQG